VSRLTFWGGARAEDHIGAIAIGNHRRQLARVLQHHQAAAPTVLATLPDQATVGMLNVVDLGFLGVVAGSDKTM
jgi:hypothetical protein